MTRFALYDLILFFYSQNHRRFTYAVRLRDSSNMELVIAIELEIYRRNASIIGVVIASIAAIWLFMIEHFDHTFQQLALVPAAFVVVLAYAACKFQWNKSIFSGELERRASSDRLLRLGTTEERNAELERLGDILRGRPADKVSRRRPRDD